MRLGLLNDVFLKVLEDCIIWNSLSGTKNSGGKKKTMTRALKVFWMILCIFLQRIVKENVRAGAAHKVFLKKEEKNRRKENKPPNNIVVLTELAGSASKCFTQANPVKPH